MITTKFIALLRRRISDVDVTMTNTDTDLMTAAEDARSLMSVKGVLGMDGYTVETDEDAVGFGFVPDLTEIDAHTVAYLAAYDLLTQRYRELVDSGALGIVWKSGLEEENTVQADKAYQTAIAVLKNEYEALILIRNRGVTGSRAT